MVKLRKLGKRRITTISQSNFRSYTHTTSDSAEETASGSTTVVVSSTQVVTQETQHVVTTTTKTVQCYDEDDIGLV